MNFRQCPGCGSQILDDVPHACVGDLRIPEIAIPPSFFVDMPDDEWTQLLKNFQLTEAQIERLYRMMGVPDERMPNVKLIKIKIPYMQLQKMEILRTRPLMAPKSGAGKRIRHMRVH